MADGIMNFAAHIWALQQESKILTLEIVQEDTKTDAISSGQS